MPRVAGIIHKIFSTTLGSTCTITVPSTKILRKETCIMGNAERFGWLSLGLTIGYFIAKRTLEKRIGALAANEINEVRAYYHQKNKQPDSTIHHKNAQDTADYENRLFDLGYRPEKIEEQLGHPVAEPEPLKPVEELSWDTEIEDDDTEPYLEGRRMSETLRLMAQDLGKPYVLTEDEYFTENEHYSKETLRYLAGSNTLLDTDEEIIPNPQDIIGDDALAYFKVRQSGLDTVYARNDKITTDYEIIREEGTYEELILGIVPDEGEE